jgi:hypothetical protein
MRLKAVFLFVALFLPVCIFLFLKFFGENEFAVPALYVDTAPPGAADCPAVDVPYAVADSVWNQLPAGNSLGLIYIGDPSTKTENMLNRIQNEVRALPIAVTSLVPDDRYLRWKHCVFFLDDPFDLVLVDGERLIRGQYESGDRKEVDRLLTEIDILLKNY